MSHNEPCATECYAALFSSFKKSTLAASYDHKNLQKNPLKQSRQHLCFKSRIIHSKNLRFFVETLLDNLRQIGRNLDGAGRDQIPSQRCNQGTLDANNATNSFVHFKIFTPCIERRWNAEVKRAKGFLQHDNEVFRMRCLPYGCGPTKSQLFLQPILSELSAVHSGLVGLGCIWISPDEPQLLDLSGLL